MDEECIESSEPIFELASECEQLFSQQVSRLRGEADPNATKAVGEFQQRFSAWAAFLGVFAVPEMCLDRKLQHHVEIQDLVLRLLDIMKRNLTYLFEANDALNGDDVELTDSHQALPPQLRISVDSLRGIEGATERLHHLGGTIQLSSEASQAARISRFATRFDSSSFEQVARLAIVSFYPDASPSLLEHVARAMTDMYQKFHYRRSRRARLQARPRATLSSIREESASSSQPNAWTANPVPVPASPPITALRRQMPRPVVRSHLGARSHQSRDSKPTSLDSQEFKKHFPQQTDGSVKSKTKSILASQMAYPPQSEDSLVCDWCFLPLSEDESKGEKWRKHLNEDFKPFVCISEKCREPLNRFATSRAWFSHMSETHGQHWHREVHLPVWYICPLCNTQDTTYPRAPDLTGHIMKCHADVFTEKQIQTIVLQSRLRSPRSQDICPLCCLSMNDGQESDEGDQFLKKAFPNLSVQDEELGESHKRIKTEAGAKQRDEHRDTNLGSTERTPSDAHASSSRNRRPLDLEAIAKHVASHLQGVMLLTLRMVALESAPEMSADDRSVSGGTDDGFSRFGSTRQLSQHEAQEIETTDKLWIQEDGNMDIDDPFLADDIPNCEHDVDWRDVTPNAQGPPETDTFLQQVIDSGAFQNKDRVTSPDTTPINVRRPQRRHPQRGAIIKLPFRRDPSFTGHESLLHNLIRRCSAPPSRIALVGMGGIGKSHLATELAHRIVLSSDASVFWIRADTQSSIEEGLEHIATNAGSRNLNEADTTLKLAFDWLSDEQNGRWLIILDGVGQKSLGFLQDDLNLLQGQNGTILVTTRRKNLAYEFAGNRHNVIEMEPMTVYDAVTLLERKLEGLEKSSLRELISTSDFVKSLGLSPLTICRAAAYIQSMPAPDDVPPEALINLNGRDRDHGDGESNEDEDDEDDESEDEAFYIGDHAVYPGSYTEPEAPKFNLEIFDAGDWREQQEDDEEKQEKARDMMARKLRGLQDNEQEMITLLEFEPSSPDGSGETLVSILKIWQSSFNAIRSERRPAAELLSLMSFFDRRGIPKWLFELRRRSHLGLHQGASSSHEINSDIETLLNHCLISSNGTKDIFSMHGLIQLAVKRSLNGPERRIYEYHFVRRLDEAFPRDVYSNWATCEELFAHVQVAANCQPSSENQLRDWASLLYHAARFARAQGRYEVAMQMAKQASEARDRLRAEDSKSAVTSSLVALIHMDQGSYDRAETLFTQVADICNDNANRTASINNLACIYKLNGRWTEADALLEEVKKIRDTSFGIDHPKTLSSMANLASLYKAQGRYSQAYELLLEVVTRCRNVLGPDHPQTLTSFNDLGSICKLLGKLEYAEKYHKHAHESRKIILGPDHPDTLASMHGLASTYRLQGRLGEAVTLQQEALKARKRILGADHPSTLASMNNLALVYRDQGWHADAVSLQAEVLDACKKKLGPDHPHTLTSMHNLALCQKGHGRHELGWQMLQDCVEARKRILGPRHPHSVSSAEALEGWTIVTPGFSDFWKVQ
ncbi:hypothetical protein J3F83DRAFT_749592 [Trichoderma novae-zelandiae]